MPDNEIGGRIHKLYELDNFSGQSQVADNNWPGVIYNQWNEKQGEISEPLTFNLNNNIQQLDSLRGRGNRSLNVLSDLEYTHFTQRPGLSNIQLTHQNLRTNDFMLGRDVLQANQNQFEFLGESTGFVPHSLGSRGLSVLKSDQEYASGDSPTLTTNSERSEITEASTEINFVGRQQQLVKGQQQVIPQHHLMQQSGYNDMQLLQQQLMFKQLQELQRQQQLQQFGDGRQHNSVNQLSAVAKQASGIQYSPFINGTPVNDTPQMLMNWVQRGASPANASSRVSFSQDQGQTLRSMGQAPQQFDVSLYGTPVASGRGTMNQYSQLQATDQAQRSAMHSSAFSNSFVGDRFSTPSPDQVSFPQGDSISKQGFQGKNVFGQVPMQSFNYGSTLRNIQQESTLQTNTSLQELSGKQDRDGWPGFSQKNTMQHIPSQGLVPLDPMEEKILYNTDDSLWDPSVVNCNDIGAGGLGSWSALMQSAVAEASSSDTGLHEEWSGLSFQNTESSTGNQQSNIMDTEKQQGTWADNNLQTASSFSSKPFPMLNDSSVNSSFPGFQQLVIQSKPEHKDRRHQDESHESIQKSPKSNSEWLGRDSQQKISLERCQPVQQTVDHLDNSWISQRNERSNCDSPQERIDPYSIVGRPSSKPEGDINEVMCKKSSDVGLWKGEGDSRVTSFSRSTGQLEQGQSGLDISLRNRQQSHIFNFPSVPNTHMNQTHQKTHQQVEDNSKLDYVKHTLSSNKEENEGIREHHHQMIPNSYGRDGETYEQQISSQKDNTYNRKPVDMSATVCRSPGPGGVQVTAGTSQNMLELLNKVDRLKDNSSVGHFGASGFNPLSEMTDAKVPASVAQMYNHSFPSQGFALKLAPPSQRQSNPNSHFPSQGLLQPAKQTDSDSREKTQVWSAPSPSSQSLTQSHESSPRAHWDDKSSIRGQSSISETYMHGSSIAEITSSPKLHRNQLQTQSLFDQTASGPSTQATLPAAVTRHSPSNLARSQDTPQSTFINPDGQQFPILESVPVSHPPFMSAMTPQGGISFRQQSWSNETSQQHLSVPMVVPSNGSTQATLTSKELNNLNPQGGYKSSEFGSVPTNLQGLNSPEGQPEKVGGEKPMVSEMPERSQTGLRNVSNPGSLVSGSLVAHTNLQDLDRTRNGDNSGLSPLARNLQFLGHALNPPHGFRQINSLLHQVQAMKNMGTDPSRRDLDVQQTVIAGQQSSCEYNKDDELNSAKPFKTSPHGTASIPSFSSDAREDSSIKTVPQSAQQAQGMVAFGESDSQNQSAGCNVTSVHAEGSRANLYMAANWFKQYGNFRNGQVPPMFDARTAVEQFSRLKPAQSINMHSSVNQIDASDASQSRRVSLSIAASVPVTAPYVLHQDASNQSTDISRPKKRKIPTYELVPWYKVTQGSKMVQDISMAEEDWALASSRLVEKVPDELGMIDDGQPFIRPKRRLICTTQFLQHLLGPAPASILSGDASLYYDTVTYFVAKLSLGDACSLACSKRNNTHKHLDNSSDMILDKLKVVESNDDQHLSKAVGDITNRSKKLEIELLRIEKAASLLDIRLECQELERFSVINRFAKFHLPRPDMSGTSSSSGTFANALRPSPQRYVTGQPLPRNLPEGVQCLSL